MSNQKLALKECRYYTSQETHSSLQVHVQALMSFGILCRVQEDLRHPVDHENLKLYLWIEVKNSEDMESALWYLGGST